MCGHDPCALVELHCPDFGVRPSDDFASSGQTPRCDTRCDGVLLVASAECTTSLPPRSATPSAKRTLQRIARRRVYD